MFGFRCGTVRTTVSTVSWRRRDAACGAAARGQASYFQPGVRGGQQPRSILLRRGCDWPFRNYVGLMHWAGVSSGKQPEPHAHPTTRATVGRPGCRQIKQTAIRPGIPNQFMATLSPTSGHQRLAPGSAPPRRSGLRRSAGCRTSDQAPGQHHRQALWHGYNLELTYSTLKGWGAPQPRTCFPMA